LPKANAIRWALLVVIVSGFLLGVVKLFLLRFEAGDLYPAYSSLRSDPLGTRALYVSLENIDASSVSRNYLPLQSLEFKEHTSFFYLGIEAFDSESVSTDLLKVFERITSAGGRLVVSFLPVEKKPANWRMRKCAEAKEEITDKEKDQHNDPTKKSETPSEPQPAESASDDNQPQRQVPSNRQILLKPEACASLKDRWGLTIAFKEKPSDQAVIVSDDLAQTRTSGLPQSISWHTALYFDQLENAWRIIYAADGQAVIVERPYGNGSLVLSADSFFLSNEALRSERHPQLLSWLISEGANIVFEETHFGIFKHPGILSLLKKHRFHGFVFSIIALALLFLWKNSVYFVPPPKIPHIDSVKDVNSNRDSVQGLVSLLRRYIPKRRLLQTCVREWERAFRSEKRDHTDKLTQIKSALQMMDTQPKKSIDPVAEYQRISKILSEGRHHE
jgi:hypothetical protein